MKISVEYDPINGLPCADGAVMELAEDIMSGKYGDGCSIATGLVFDAIRVLIKTGIYLPSDVEFDFDGAMFYVNEHGSYYGHMIGGHYPGDIQLDLLSQL